MKSMGQRTFIESTEVGSFETSDNLLQHPDRDGTVFAVIDSRNLERECFVRVIRATHQGISISAFGSVDEWRKMPQAPTTILLNIGSRRASTPPVMSEIRRLAEEVGETPVIVLAEAEELKEMIAAIDSGAKGYIPASVGVDVIIEAARLTAMGGVFLPLASLLALRETIAKDTDRPCGIPDYFTSRQAAVADALRRGKANKTIAYELNMCESTVKVHIRTIMKKLRATNRTQAAFKLNDLFPREAESA